MIAEHKVEKLLIAGLGNPGGSYESTRHNAGFLFLDKLAGRDRFRKVMFKGQICEETFGGTKLYCLKPQTFMNLSGESVGPALSYFRLTPDRLLVVHDDLDLPTGDVRFKAGGGLAGHNGLKSVAKHTGTQDFLRLRIGIGRPEGRIPVIDYVLGRFCREELLLLEEALDTAVNTLRVYLEEGTDAAMSFCNGRFKAKKIVEAKL